MLNPSHNGRCDGGALSLVLMTVTLVRADHVHIPGTCCACFPRIPPRPITPREKKVTVVLQKKGAEPVADTWSKPRVGDLLGTAGAPGPLHALW
jgi:hypothetical protein